MSRKAGLRLDFVGIGAPRCASTWVFRCLEAHPQVCTSRAKEIPFFNDSGNYARGLEWYRWFFEHCRQGQVCGEFNPNYLADPAAAARIHDLFPQVRLLVTLRDPVAALHSLYRFRSYRGRYRYPDFGAFLEAEPDAVGLFRYHERLGPFLERFPRERFHFMLQEDIVGDPRRAVRELYAFLGVDPAVEPPAAGQRINVARRGPRAWLARPVYAGVGLLERLPGGPAVVSRLKRSPLQGLAERWLSASAGGPAPAEATGGGVGGVERARLVEHYRDDIESLEALLGRDLGAWKAPSQTLKR